MLSEPMIEKARQWKELTAKKKELSAALDVVKRELEEIEPALVEGMASAQVQSFVLDGEATVHLQTAMRCYLKRPGDETVQQSWERAAKVLEALGLDEEMGVRPWCSLSSVGAYCRSLEEAGKPVPEELSSVFEIQREARIGLRQRSSKEKASAARAFDAAAAGR